MATSRDITWVFRAVDKTGAAFRSVDSQISGISRSLKTFAGYAGFATIAASVGVLGKELITLGSLLNDMSQRLGISVEKLQGFKLGAEETGSSLESFQQAVAFLTKLTGNAVAGNQKAIDSFARLGISVEKFAALSNDRRLAVIAEVIKGGGTEAEKAEKAYLALGRGATTLIPLFRGGAQAIDEYQKKAEKLGIITQEQSDILDKAEDDWKAFWTSVKVGAVPALTAFIDFSRGVIKAWDDTVHRLGKGFAFPGAIPIEITEPLEKGPTNPRRSSGGLTTTERQARIEARDNLKEDKDADKERVRSAQKAASEIEAILRRTNTAQETYSKGIQRLAQLQKSYGLDAKVAAKETLLLADAYAKAGAEADFANPDLTPIEAYISGLNRIVSLHSTTGESASVAASRIKDLGEKFEQARKSQLEAPTAPPLDALVAGLESVLGKQQDVTAGAVALGKELTGLTEANPLRGYAAGLDEVSGVNPFRGFNEGLANLSEKDPLFQYKTSLEEVSGINPFEPYNEGLAAISRVDPFITYKRGLISIQDVNPFATATDGLTDLSGINPFGAYQSGLDAISGVDPFADFRVGLAAIADTDPLASFKQGLAEVKDVDPFAPVVISMRELEDINPLEGYARGLSEVSGADPFGGLRDGLASLEGKDPLSTYRTSLEYVSGTNPFRSYEEGLRPLLGVDPLLAYREGLSDVKDVNPFTGVTAGLQELAGINPFGAYREGLDAISGVDPFKDYRIGLANISDTDPLESFKKGLAEVQGVDPFADVILSLRDLEEINPLAGYASGLEEVAGVDPFAGFREGLGSLSDKDPLRVYRESLEYVSGVNPFQSYKDGLDPIVGVDPLIAYRHGLSLIDGVNPFDDVTVGLETLAKINPFISYEEGLAAIKGVDPFESFKIGLANISDVDPLATFKQGLAEVQQSNPFAGFVSALEGLAAINPFESYIQSLDSIRDVNPFEAYVHGLDAIAAAVKDAGGPTEATQRSTELLAKAYAQLQTQVALTGERISLLNASYESVQESQARLAAIDPFGKYQGALAQLSVYEQLNGATEETIKYRQLLGQAYASEQTALFLASDAGREYVDILTSIEARTKAAITPTEEYAAKVRELEKALAIGAVTPENFATIRKFDADEYIEAQERAAKGNDELSDSTKKLFNDLKLAADGFARDLTDVFFDTTNDIGDMFKKLAETIAKALFTEAVSKPLVDGILGAFGGARAAGGPVGAGQSYIVGEKGPELFVPKSSGTILPNGTAIGRDSMQPVHVTLNISSVDPHTAAQTIAQQERLITGMIRRATLRAGRRPALA